VRGLARPDLASTRSPATPGRVMEREVDFGILRRVFRRLKADVKRPAWGSGNVSNRIVKRKAKGSLVGSWNKLLFATQAVNGV
jgi:hypothetical protein